MADAGIAFCKGLAAIALQGARNKGRLVQALVVRSRIERIRSMNIRTWFELKMPSIDKIF